MSSRSNPRLSGDRDWLLQGLNKEDPSAVTSTPSPETPDLFFAPPNQAFLDAGHYTRLEEAHQEIRLIKILPDEEDNLVRCELLKPIALVKESDRFSYWALSYSAGDVHDLTTIEVNGTPFTIFTSLAKALRAIPKGRIDLLWIDQICINQHDVNEKAWQVSMMSLIYSAAVTTLVYLGCEMEAGTGDELSMLAACIQSNCSQVMTEYYKEDGAILDLSEKVRQCKTAAEKENLRIGLIRVQSHTAHNIAEMFWKDELPFTCITQLAQVCKASWWSRCWTQQELIVSQAVILVINSSEWMPWTIFRYLIRIPQYLARIMLENLDRTVEAGKESSQTVRNALIAIIGECDRMIQLDSLHVRWQAQKGFPLRELIERNRNFESIDARDRMYSVTSLWNTERRIIPNYGPGYTLNHALTDFAREAIGHDKCIDILADAGEYDRPSESDLPTWVPNYSIPLGRANICPTSASTHRIMSQSFCAGGELAIDPSIAQITIFEKGVFKLKHLQLRVQACFKWPELQQDDFPATEFDDSCIDSNRKSWMAFVKKREAETMSTVYKPHPEITNDDALCFTLTMGHTEYLVDAWMMMGKDPEKPVADEHLYFVLKHEVYATLRSAQAGDWQFFFTLAHGIIGLVPRTTQTGDLICIIPGASVPFVIRPDPSLSLLAMPPAETYTLVGAAYVHGYMKGLAVEELERNEWTRREILLT